MIKGSIKSEAEKSYWKHCWDAFEVIYKVERWDLKGLREALCTFLDFIFAFLVSLCFPISVPIVGYIRKRNAIKMY